MTKISEYPIISNPTEDDILIGTDVNSSDVTKNFSIGSIISLADENIKPYKSYTALLTQTGISAPTALVLENTTELTFTFTRQDVGDYFIVPSTSFIDLNKILCLSTSSVMLAHIDVLADNVNGINIYTSNLSQDGGAVLVDEYLINTPIEIRIYN